MNCLFFALKKWFTEGGYIIIRKAHYGWYPHFIWCKDLRDAEIEHYVPVIPCVLRKGIHRFIFEGQVLKKETEKKVYFNTKFGKIIDYQPDETKYIATQDGEYLCKGKWKKLKAGQTISKSEFSPW